MGSNILIIEHVLPVQMASVPARLRSPERHLVAAVLQEGIKEYSDYRYSRDPRGKRLFEEVRKWLASDDESWPLSFVCCCHWLGIDPASLREEIFSSDFSFGMKQLHKGRSHVSIA